MSVKRVKRSIAVCLLLAGCGPKVDVPSDWMIGVFSTRLPGKDDYPGFERYRFQEDGVLVKEVFQSCTSSPRSVLELEWESAAENKVRIPVPPEEWGGTEALVLERLAGCDEFRIYRERQGTESVDYPVYRGEICLRKDFCPDGYGEIIDCGCILEYCDGEPPPLECEEP